MAIDGSGTVAGDLFLVRCPAAPPYCSLTLALCSWPVGAAHPATLHLPSAVRICSMVPHTAGTVHSGSTIDETLAQASTDLLIPDEKLLAACHEEK